MHIKNIFLAGELKDGSVCKKCLQTAADGKTYDMSFYNLDMIIGRERETGRTEAGSPTRRTTRRGECVR